MKRKLSAVLAAFAAVSVAACAAAGDISVLVNGSAVDFDVPPIILDGTTMLPVRKALEPLGAEFEWNGERGTVDIEANGKSITLLIDSDFAVVDGELKVLNKPAMITDGRTLIPIRFVAEELGYDVDWDGATSTVIINSVNAEADGTEEEAGDFVLRVLELVNEERAKEGLKPLVLNDALCAVAQQHCDDMAARGFFDHINPDGESPFDRMDNYGIWYMAAGENIAAGQRSPESVMESWMNSPGHRANILSSDYGEIGIAYTYGGSYGVYWTQCFADKVGINNTQEEADDFVLRVLELVNEERAKEGLKALVLDDALCAVAQQHCDDMVARSFFDHINPDGESPFDRMENNGIWYMAAGENIAAGQRTPEAVMESWMNSPGHRANILSSDYGKIGIAYTNGGDFKIYWTQCFTN